MANDFLGPEASRVANGLSYGDFAIKLHGDAYAQPQGDLSVPTPGQSPGKGGSASGTPGFDAGLGPDPIAPAGGTPAAPEKLTTDRPSAATPTLEGRPDYSAIAPGSSVGLIPPPVPTDAAWTGPPSREETLEKRRDEIRHYLGQSDTSLAFVVQSLINAGVAFKTSGEHGVLSAEDQLRMGQLSSERRALTALKTAEAPEALAKVIVEEENLKELRLASGRFRGLGTVAAVVAAEWATDKLFFENDAVKGGTLLADFVASPAIMWLMPGGLVAKGTGMVGAHLFGKLYDHYHQQKVETATTTAVSPGFKLPDLKSLLPGPQSNAQEPGHQSWAQPLPAEQLRRWTKDFDLNAQAPRDAQAAENHANQLRNQARAQQRFAEWHEALGRWRQEHPGASNSQEFEFMRDWYQQWDKQH